MCDDVFMCENKSIDLSNNLSSVFLEFSSWNASSHEALNV